MAKSSSTALATRPTDKLTQLKALGAEARDLEARRDDLNAQVAAVSASLLTLYREKMPALMNELGIDNIGVEPRGNLPGIDFEKKNYYSANIAAAWPPEKKETAFATLKRFKAEDLIKTEVVARFGKGKMPLAKKLLAAAKKLKIATVEVKLSVHSGTLASWLREVYEGGQSIPQADLDKIGASVGSYVKPKEREE